MATYGETSITNCNGKVRYTAELGHVYEAWIETEIQPKVNEVGSGRSHTVIESLAVCRIRWFSCQSSEAGFGFDLKFVQVD